MASSLSSRHSVYPQPAISESCIKSLVTYDPRVSKTLVNSYHFLSPQEQQERWYYLYHTNEDKTGKGALLVLDFSYGGDIPTTHCN